MVRNWFAEGREPAVPLFPSARVPIEPKRRQRLDWIILGSALSLMVATAIMIFTLPGKTELEQFRWVWGFSLLTMLAWIALTYNEWVRLAPPGRARTFRFVFVVIFAIGVVTMIYESVHLLF